MEENNSTETMQMVAVFDVRTGKVFALFEDGEHAVKYGKSLIGEFSDTKIVNNITFYNGRK
ncbi:MAG: hypothetical protein V4547_17585 [Bacteroidota bacterium]